MIFVWRQTEFFIQIQVREGLRYSAMDTMKNWNVSETGLLRMRRREIIDGQEDGMVW